LSAQNLILQVASFLCIDTDASVRTQVEKHPCQVVSSSYSKSAAYVANNHGLSFRSQWCRRCSVDTSTAMLVHLGRYLDRLHPVPNAATWLTNSVRNYDHVTPVLSDLYWLHFWERTQFKLVVLATSVMASQIRYVAKAECRRNLKSASTSALVVSVNGIPLETVRFSLLRLKLGKPFPS
jgi:hypothetical protein